MSTPLNPLSKYETYSYHHILAVADNTKTVDDIIRGNLLFAGFTERTRSSGSLKTTPNGGVYKVLINGTSDAKFFIDDLKWKSYNNSGGIDNLNNNTSTVTGGSFVVKEPKGVELLNVMANSAREVGIDSSLAIWVIKTFIVGHYTENGTTSTDYITNLQPLVFTIVDIKSSFEEYGAEYTIEFMNTYNGVQRHPGSSNVVSDLKINFGISQSYTLAKIFASVNTELARKSTDDYNTVKSELSALQSSDQYQYVPFKVNYKIILADEYQSNEYKLDTLPNVTRDTLNSPPIMDFSKYQSITHLINDVMTKCQMVLDELTQNNTRQKYRIKTVFESNSTESTLYYLIIREHYPFENIASIVGQEPEHHHALELDYYYSGKNIDIVDFSLNMNYGLAIYQALVTGSNLDDASSTEQSADTIEKNMPNNGVSIDPEDNLKKTIRIPVFPGENVPSVVGAHTTTPNDHATYQYILDRFAQLETIESSVTIIGNPDLLNSMESKPVIDPTGLKFTYENAGESVLFPKYNTIPALVKINVYSLSDDETNGLRYPQKFWFTGYYYIISIEHSFSDGEFSQTLDMMSLVKDDTLAVGPADIVQLDKKNSKINSIDPRMSAAKSVRTTMSEN